MKLYQNIFKAIFVGSLLAIASVIITMSLISFCSWDNYYVMPGEWTVMARIIFVAGSVHCYAWPLVYFDVVNVK